MWFARPGACAPFISVDGCSLLSADAPANSRSIAALVTNKLEAQQLHDKLKTASWRVERLGKRLHTWTDATDETSPKRTDHNDVLKLRWLAQFLGSKLLTQVTRDVVAAIGARKRSEVSAATANRFLALIRAILLRACNDWE